MSAGGVAGGSLGAKNRPREEEEEEARLTEERKCLLLPSASWRRLHVSVLFPLVFVSRDVHVLLVLSAAAPSDPRLQVHEKVGQSIPFTCTTAVHRERAREIVQI